SGTALPTIATEPDHAGVSIPVVEVAAAKTFAIVVLLYCPVMTSVQLLILPLPSVLATVPDKDTVTVTFAPAWPNWNPPTQNCVAVVVQLSTRKFVSTKLKPPIERKLGVLPGPNGITVKPRGFAPWARSRIDPVPLMAAGRPVGPVTLKEPVFPALPFVPQPAAEGLPVFSGQKSMRPTPPI